MAYEEAFKSSEDIKADIELTRAALLGKLVALEDRVQDRVTSVKETVTETVESVKEKFDLSYQMSERPWVVLGAAFGAGFMLDSIFRSSLQASNEPNQQEMSTPRGDVSLQRAGLLSQLSEEFSGESKRIKGTLLDAGMGLARELAKASLPAPFGQYVDEISGRLGKRIRSSLIPE